MKFFSRNPDEINESRDFTVLFKDKEDTNPDVVEDINNLRDIIQTLLGKLETVETEKSDIAMKYEGLEEENVALRQKIEHLSMVENSSRNDLPGTGEPSKETYESDNDPSDVQGHGDHITELLASNSILEMDSILFQSEDVVVSKRDKKVQYYTASSAELQSLEEYLSAIKKGISEKDMNIKKLQDKERQQRSRINKLTEEVTNLKNLTECQNQEISIKNKDIKMRLQEISTLRKQMKMLKESYYKVDSNRESLVKPRGKGATVARDRTNKKPRSRWHQDTPTYQV